MRRRGERGTTLLEIVITVAIVTIGMLGYFTMHIRSFQVASSTSSMAQAASLAAALQDQLVAIPYTDYNSLPSTSPLAVDTCTSALDVDPLKDLCKKAPSSAINAKGVTDSKGTFIRTYQVEIDPASVDLTQPALIVSVRVRYVAEDGRCPSCADSSLRQGWKAVTTRTRRTIAAY